MFENCICDDCVNFGDLQDEGGAQVDWEEICEVVEIIWDKEWVYAEYGKIGFEIGQCWRVFFEIEGRTWSCINNW